MVRRIAFIAFARRSVFPTAFAGAFGLLKVGISDHCQELIGRPVGTGRALEECSEVVISDLGRLNLRRISDCGQFALRLIVVGQPVEHFGFDCRICAESLRPEVLDALLQNWRTHVHEEQHPEVGLKR